LAIFKVFGIFAGLQIYFAEMGYLFFKRILTGDFIKKMYEAFPAEKNILIL
jgi:hypothetical protein